MRWSQRDRKTKEGGAGLREEMEVETDEAASQKTSRVQGPAPGRWSARAAGARAPKGPAHHTHQKGLGRVDGAPSEEEPQTEGSPGRESSGQDGREKEPQAPPTCPPQPCPSSGTELSGLGCSSSCEVACGDRPQSAGVWAS